MGVRGVQGVEGDLVVQDGLDARVLRYKLEIITKMKFKISLFCLNSISGIQYGHQN